MDIRNFFFKNRSFTPIPIALSIIYFAQSDNHYINVAVYPVYTAKGKPRPLPEC